MKHEELEYVGFWPRVGATVIDTVIVLAITLPILFAIYGEYYLYSTKIVEGPADFIISWVLPAVAVICFWITKRATPGKMAVGASVVDERTGNTMSTGQAILRYLAYFVSILPLFLGLVWVAFDPKKQGWHDKIAGTVVIRPKDRSPAPVEFG